MEKIERATEFYKKWAGDDSTIELMAAFADQETAPLKIENGRMSDTINALIRSGSEKDTEISRLKQRLADCERKRLTGEKI